MYTNVKYNRTGISKNTAVEGSTLEQKIERMISNKEQIKGEAPLIFTERKDGVQPSYDIRADRFDIAVDAMDKAAKSYQARREERHNPKMEVVKDEENGGTESTQSTN